MLQRACVLGNRLKNMKTMRSRARCRGAGGNRLKKRCTKSAHCSPSCRPVRGDATVRKAAKGRAKSAAWPGMRSLQTSGAHLLKVLLLAVWVLELRG